MREEESMTFLDFQKEFLIKNDNAWARRTYMKMKHNVPFYAGRCRFCEKDHETLYPVLADLCYNCSKALPEMGCKLIKVKRFHMQQHECAKCTAKVWKLYQFNVDVCSPCMRKFWDPSGRREHTF